MLGTRLILLAMDDFPEANTDTQAEVVAVANHQIPVMWLLAFTQVDIRCFPVGEGDDAIIKGHAGSEYPLLVAKRESLVANLGIVFEQMESSLSEADRALFKEWSAFVEQQTASVLALDTYELWLTKPEEGALLAELNQMFSLFETIATHSSEALEQMKKTGLWQSENRIALAGYGW